MKKLKPERFGATICTRKFTVLGFGVRIGFLGLLHMDIVKERLEREYGLELVVTNPSTDYHVVMTSGEALDIKSASDLPDPAKIEEIREPWIKVR